MQFNANATLPILSFNEKNLKWITDPQSKSILYSDRTSVM